MFTLRPMNHSNTLVVCCSSSYTQLQINSVSRGRLLARCSIRTKDLTYNPSCARPYTEKPNQIIWKNLPKLVYANVVSLVQKRPKKLSLITERLGHRETVASQSYTYTCLIGFPVFPLRSWEEGEKNIYHFFLIVVTRMLYIEDITRRRERMNFIFEW